MRETQEGGGVGSYGLCKEKRLEGVSTREGALQRVDTAAQNTARAAAGRARGTTAAWSPPPARHHGKIRRTIHYWLFYTSRRGRGFYTK